MLEQALRLLHPFMPYITEELWQQLPGTGKHLLHSAYRDAEPTIMLAAYPEVDGEFDQRRCRVGDAGADRSDHAGAEHSFRDANQTERADPGFDRCAG